MLDQTIVNQPLLMLALWVITYLADYYVTVYSASLYQKHVAVFMQFGGSYELTPQFQRDIDQLRRVSPRFVAALLFGCLMLLLFWWLAVRIVEAPWIVALLAGGLILREAAVLIRHARNLVTFRAVQHPRGAEPAMQGQLAMARWLVLRQSAADMLAFAALFLLLAVLDRSVFLAGGALGCATVAVRQLLQTGKAARSARP